MNTNLIKEKIKESIIDADIKVIDTTGTNDHFKVIVISDEFKNMTLIERHRRVYKTIDQFLTKEIHALQLSTKTFEEDKNE